jgi:glycosyltransferase involved in cell wall biosynthesis
VKILFDCRYVRYPRHDGISRFSSSLVTALGAIHPVTMIISDERQLAMLPDLPWVKAASPTSVMEPFAARSLNKYNPDIVYTVMQTMGPRGRKFPFVSTVHDLIYYENPTPPRNLPVPIRGLWRLYHLSWWPQRSVLKLADAHVSVSETTKALMIEHELTPHPIAVVYNAADVHDDSDRELPSGKDLVYMGSFMPYKNVETLVHGMRELPEYTLHLMSAITPSDRERLERVNPQAKLEFHNGASDDEYLALLRRAVALVSASRNEGFGLPIVESMAVGTPVVASDIPVFREIGADAVVYFDPNDPAEFAAAVRSIEDPVEWADRSRASRSIASAFRWDSSARKLLDFLTSVVNR